MAKIDFKARYRDPKYLRMREENMKRLIEASRNPWNRMADAVLLQHGDSLAASERGFVRTMAGSMKTPSQRKLDRLAAIAKAVGTIDLH